MWLSMAQALSHLQQKTRSHRRACITTHMSRHLEDYESFWDKRGPDDLHWSKTFKDYVDTISQTGQYVGALEVYAAAHVLSIRVYIVHELGQVYLFNREGEGSPVVLYYSASAKHCEWLEGDLEVQLQPREQGGKPKCDGLRS